MKYYEQHADVYVRDTIVADVAELYAEFLPRLPAGGLILDAGCGSGRDSKAFLALGYQVISIDAVAAMVDAATNLTGQAARQMKLQEVDFPPQFDGIWACASLLHLSWAELPDVLKRLARALRPEGVIFASFKYGRGERIDELGRFFTDLDEERAEKLLQQVPELRLLKRWTSGDYRRREVTWSNLLLGRS